MIKGKKIAADLLAAVMVFGSLSAGLPGVQAAVRPAANVGAAKTDYGIAAPIVSKENTTWDTIYFGNYPQSRYFPKKTISDPETGKVYADLDENSTRFVWLDGKYFKYEPIRWRVLSVSGDDAFLIADQNLDGQVYHTKDAGVTWAESTIRSWLNGYDGTSNAAGVDYSAGNSEEQTNFINMAFSSAEKVKLKDTHVGTFNGVSASDKVYLASVEEVSNRDYGFDVAFASESITRYAQNSDYAAAMGANVSTEAVSRGNGKWILRSPGYNAFHVADVQENGSGHEFGVMVNELQGIRPVIHMDLSTAAWGTSHWTKGERLRSDRKKEYILTLNANGGKVAASGADAPAEIVEFIAAENMTLSAMAVPTPVRTGYVFDGWYTKQTGGEAVSMSYVPTAAMTLYAHWTRDLGANVTIHFDPNGGTVETKSRTIDLGDAIGTLETPVRTGYTFEGWYTAKVGGIKITEEDKPQENVVVYAHWTEEKEADTYVKVTFNPNGGAVIPASKSVLSGEQIGTLPTPVRTGYTFDGWYTAMIGGTKAAATDKPTADLTLYAHWTAAKTNTGNSNSNSKTSGTQSTSTTKTTTVKAPGKVRITNIKLVAWNKIKITWKKVSGADGYVLYCRVGRYGYEKKIKTLKASVKSFTVKNLKAGKTYYYWLYAFKKSGTEKVYGKLSTSKGIKIKGKVGKAKLKGKPGKHLTYTYTWNKIKNAEWVELYRSVNGGKYKKIKKIKANRRKITLNLKGIVSPGDYHYYYIKAYYKEDGITVSSTSKKKYIHISVKKKRAGNKKWQTSYAFDVLR